MLIRFIMLNEQNLSEVTEYLYFMRYKYGHYPAKPMIEFFTYISINMLLTMQINFYYNNIQKERSLLYIKR